MKKIPIILILGTILTSIIYFNVDNKKNNLLILGDGLSTGMTAYQIESYDFNDYLATYLNEEEKLNKYYKEFNETDETLSGLITKINNNIENIDKNITIKQAIKNSNIITIAIGMDELNNYASKNILGSTKINGYIKKYDELLNTIRAINKNKIFIIGLYSSKNINQNKIEKINMELYELSKKHNVNFIDISNITDYEEFFSIKSNYYLNYKGQKYIFEIIKNNLKANAVVNII